MGTLGAGAGRVRAVQWVGWTVCKRRGFGRGGSGAAHTTLVVHQVPLRHIWHLHKWERSNRRMRYKLHWRLGRRGMYSMGWGHAGAPVPAFREPSQTLSALRCTIRHYAGTTIWVQGEPGGGRARRAWPHERAAGCPPGRPRIVNRRRVNRTASSSPTPAQHDFPIYRVRVRTPPRREYAHARKP